MAEMHFGPSRGPAGDPSIPWHRELTRYHWFVLIVAALGWVFDCLDQQLFNLARKPAMTELLGLSPSDPRVDTYGAWATSIFLMGWATGGIAFGILGDRIGRAKTMMLTILIYSICTGLSALSVSWWDFSIYRFLTGLGVGGEFAVGVALVAEVMPDRARPFALGLLQALSTVGNISAALITMGLGHLEETGAIGSAWRWMFVIGTFPALLALVIRRKLKEPERWQAAVAEGGQQVKLGSIAELFGDPRWRHRAIVGLILASVGVIGLWGIGFFSIDLNRTVFRNNFEAEFRAAGEAETDRKLLRALLESRDALAPAVEKVHPSHWIKPDQQVNDPEVLHAAALELYKAEQQVSPEAVLAALDNATEKSKPQTPEERVEERARRQAYLAVEPLPSAAVAAEVERVAARAKAMNGRITFWVSVTSMMLNVGAFFGIWAFSRVTHLIGRRPAFAIGFIGAMLSTAWVFMTIDEVSDVFWMVPIMGFWQLSVFGGYAIYFPELFPTRLRSTGTSFCYNVGRFVAALGPFTLGYLTSDVFGAYPEPMRYAGFSMCSIFLVGLIALPFAPETKGQPLPE